MAYTKKNSVEQFIHKECLVLAQFYKIYLNLAPSFLSRLKKHITTSDLYAISCDQKSVLSYLSILTLSIVHLFVGHLKVWKIFFSLLLRSTHVFTKSHLK